MRSQLVRTISRLGHFMGSLVVTVVAGLITWGFWGYYQEISRKETFVREGTPVTVRVESVDHKQSTWRDVFGNSAYLTFHQRGRPYTVRYVSTGRYVGPGDRVALLYHAGADAYEQSPTDLHSSPAIPVSRLVDWSLLRWFSQANTLLFLCLMLSVAVFFLVSGLINSIVPVPLLQQAAGVLLKNLLVAAALFVTYDTYKYFQFLQQVTTAGKPVTVRVLATDRTRRFQNHSTSPDLFDPIYTYQATVVFRRQPRRVAISEADFNHLKPGAPLRAVYAQSPDELLSADYSPDYTTLFVPMAFWLLALVVIGSGSRQNASATG